jgi:glycosyltransferase involved in cell wall biosynthesis
MHVCLATYQSVNLLKGGPRTQILQTKKSLEKLGVKVSLFESWQEFELKNVDIFHLFSANIGTYHLAREIHKLGIPMVVTPIFYTRRSAATVRTVIRLNRIVGKIIRGTWTDYGLIAEICSWANMVLPNTTSEFKLFHHGFAVPESKMSLVPNGVEERFYYAEAELFKKTYGVENFILNVGHIGPERKNVLNLLRALETIDHPAVIIGRIEENDYGRQCLQKAKNNPRLLVLDNLPNNSDLLASAYAACDVFVLPSQFETPGIAALEAALAGAKIVITQYGGTHDYFQHDAEYVDPTSVNDIRQKILTALAKPKTPALRERVRKEFLWENVGERTREVYREIAK